MPFYVRLVLCSRFFNQKFGNHSNSTLVIKKAFGLTVSSFWSNLYHSDGRYFIAR